jgi:hypothetical protein
MASHSPAQPVGVYQKKYAQFSLRLYSKACESMVGCVHGKPLRDELVPWLTFQLRAVLACQPPAPYGLPKCRRQQSGGRVWA